jgi:hypothetical protein
VKTKGFTRNEMRFEGGGPPKYDPAEIKKALQLMVAPSEVVELRAPNTPKGVVSGYYDDLDKLAGHAAYWSGVAESVYVTLNPVRRDLLARSCNRVTTYAKHITRDPEVLHRRWLLIDCDPVRPAGISANDAEHEVALERALRVRDWLSDRWGWKDAIFADSGNGAHLLYRCELPNDAAVAKAQSGCLDSLAKEFNDERVTIDPTTFNASRISKLYGTLAAKGDHVPDLGRVYRIARILETPEGFE